MAAWGSIRISAVQVAENEITHGIQITAENTGLNYSGISTQELTTAGATTFSTPGEVVENFDFSGPVVLNADGIVFKNCRIRVPAGSSIMGLRVNGDNITIEGCLIHTQSGSGYEGIVLGGNGTTIRRCEVYNYENNITIDGSNWVVEECYMHDASNVSNPSGHRDCLEIFATNNGTIRKNRLTHPIGETSTINIAPWWTGSSVDGVDVVDNYIDGAGYTLTIDNQADGIFNVRFLRNIFGGNYVYGIRRGADSNDPQIVRTTGEQTTNPETILWPDTGDDVNTDPSGNTIN